jgi:hypothetical protein
MILHDLCAPTSVSAVAKTFKSSNYFIHEAEGIQRKPIIEGGVDCEISIQKCGSKVHIYDLSEAFAVKKNII